MSYPGTEDCYSNFSTIRRFLENPGHNTARIWQKMISYRKTQLSIMPLHHEYMARSQMGRIIKVPDKNCSGILVWSGSTLRIRVISGRTSDRITPGMINDRTSERITTRELTN